MKKFNKKKDDYIKRFPDLLLEQQEAQLSTNIKFSFEYFDNSQSAGQDFYQWDHEQLSKLLVKLKEFSRNTVRYWNTLKIGHTGNTVLAIYNNFPVRSEFTHPKHVPIDVQWACFRLEREMRLVGFLISPDSNFEKTVIDKSIFYVVFLDKNHNFFL